MRVALPLSVLRLVSLYPEECTVNVRPLSTSSIGPLPASITPHTVNRMKQALGDTNLTPAWTGNMVFSRVCFTFHFLTPSQPHPEGSTLLLKFPSSASLPQVNLMACTPSGSLAPRPRHSRPGGPVPLDPSAGLLGKQTYRKTIGRKYLHPDWEEGGPSQEH